jgi:hypothetical protein
MGMEGTEGVKEARHQETAVWIAVTLKVGDERRSS